MVDDLILVTGKCDFTDTEMVQLQRNAVEMCWAGEKDKWHFWTNSRKLGGIIVDLL